MFLRMSKKLSRNMLLMNNAALNKSFELTNIVFHNASLNFGLRLWSTLDHGVACKNASLRLCAVPFRNEAVADASDGQEMFGL